MEKIAHIKKCRKPEEGIARKINETADGVNSWILAKVSVVGSNKQQIPGASGSIVHGVNGSVITVILPTFQTSACDDSVDPPVQKTATVFGFINP